MAIILKINQESSCSTVESSSKSASGKSQNLTVSKPIVQGSWDIYRLGQNSRICSEDKDEFKFNDYSDAFGPHGLSYLFHYKIPGWRKSFWAG